MNSADLQVEYGDAARRALRVTSPPASATLGGAPTYLRHPYGKLTSLVKFSARDHATLQVEAAPTGARGQAPAGGDGRSCDILRSVCPSPTERLGVTLRDIAQSPVLSRDHT